MIVANILFYLFSMWRILDACGLFYSGSVGFCINAPRKIGNSLKQCVRYLLFLSAQCSVLLGFQALRSEPPFNILAEELLFPYKLPPHFWPQLIDPGIGNLPKLDKGTSLKLVTFSSGWVIMWWKPRQREWSRDTKGKVTWSYWKPSYPAEFLYSMHKISILRNK